MNVSKAAMSILVLLASPALGAAAQKPVAPRPDGDTRLDYVIGPADTLQIFVWKEPDLTKDLTVRLDGRITVPLIGDVEAAGRSPQQLGEDLVKALGKFVESPRVTVGVLQANSTRFYVVGLVGKSGDFPLTGKTTLLQALALAGGFKDFAKTDSIMIVRQERAGQIVIPVNYKKLVDGKDVSQNVALRPGDTIVVP